MQVLSTRAIGLEISSALVLQGSFVRWAQIRRAAEEPGNVLRKYVEHLARGIPAGNPLLIRRKYREDYGPSPGEVRAVASGRSRSRSLNTWLGRNRRAPLLQPDFASCS